MIKRFLCSRRTVGEQILPRDAMRKRGLCCRSVSVRPSVRLSRSCTCIQTAGDIVKLLSRPGIVIFTLSTGIQFQLEPLQRGGRKIHGGGENLRFSTEIALYLGNGKDSTMVARER